MFIRKMHELLGVIEIGFDGDVIKVKLDNKFFVLEIRWIRPDECQWDKWAH